MFLPAPIVLEGVATSVLFMRNWSVSRVLEAATWKSNPVFASFYLRDVSLAFDGFRALGPVVAAGSVTDWCVTGRGFAPRCVQL